MPLHYTDDVLRPTVRLHLLQALDACPARTAPGYLLRELIERAGLVIAEHQLAGELAWLADLGAVRLADDGDAATLTTLGDDIAAGRTGRTGIARPRAGG